MSESLSFFVAMKPKQKGNSKRIVKFGKRFSLIGDEKARQAEQTLTALLLPHRPPEPFRGPVRLDVTFVFPVAESWPAWKKQAAHDGRLRHVSTPDRGNCLKLVEDAMNGLFYVDDSQVVDGRVEKEYGPRPGYQITLTPLLQAEKPVLAKCARAGCRRKVDHVTSHYCSVACQEADEPPALTS